MKFKTVEYRKLITHGQYNNTSIGAVAEVRDDQNPEEVLDALESWVNGALSAKVKAIEGLYDEQEKLYRVERDLRDRKRDLEEAERRFERAQALLASHGIVMEKTAGIWDDMPF